MAEPANRRVVFLHQGIGRAGHLQRRLVGGTADQGASQRGFAGPQGPFQQDGIPGAKAGRDLLAERLGRGKIRQVQFQRRFSDEHRMGFTRPATTSPGWL